MRCDTPLKMASNKKCYFIHFNEVISFQLIAMPAFLMYFKLCPNDYADTDNDLYQISDIFRMIES